MMGYFRRFWFALKHLTYVSFVIDIKRQPLLVRPFDFLAALACFPLTIVLALIAAADPHIESIIENVDPDLDDNF